MARKAHGLRLPEDLEMEMERERARRGIPRSRCSRRPCCARLSG